MMALTCPHWDRDSWLSSPDYIAYMVGVLSELLDIHTHSRLLDIGCGRAHIIVALAQQYSLKYPIEGIDISDTIHQAPILQGIDITQIDGCTYLQYKADNHYHGILLKQVFHLMEEDQRRQLLSLVKRTLKPKGKALIMLMPSEMTLPMFAQGKITFSQGQLNFREVMTLGEQCGLTTSVSTTHFDVKMDKEDYFKLLRQRFISNLRNLSDNDIERGIAELNDAYPHKIMQFQDGLHIVQLQKY